ncbi:MAG: hypothetical protein KatS3mg023_1000 [Armatimonadota bacterium]|nr:MAG: hypothetical protein KatS3mg023_1000 [Armatimonadota bacterium]
MDRKSYVVLLLLVAVVGCYAQSPAPRQPAQAGLVWVWWEGEKPSATNFPERHTFEPANPQEASVLSEGRWIGADGNYGGKTLFLEYEVRVPQTGNYFFFARKFWKHGPFRWRFDDGAWQICDRDVSLLDEAPLRPLLVANWVSLGQVKLTAGTHRLRIEVLQNEGAVCFDAFLLTSRYIVPRGKLKPNERYNMAMDGWFAFEPAPDAFRPSPIDLRFLNEKVAGENGWIIVKNGQFVHSKTGKPVRFWAVNAGPDIIRMDRASVDYLARHLAKYGVNMVRIHGGIWGDDYTKVDREYLDKYFYFISAMKREGIYVTLSIYFPLWLRFTPQDGYGDYNNQHPFAMPFFNKRFQEIYKGWWRELMTTRNPYTGIALKDEPAVAMVELMNEDSYFFWTFTPYQNIPAQQMEILEKEFGNWLRAKYGSLGAAFATWGGDRIRGDDEAAGRAGFMGLWEMFNQRNKRAQDTAEFLAKHQRAWFAQMRDYVKKELGYKGLVQASNWITASAQILGPLDKWSNAVCDYMDRHGYFGGPHEGERAGWSLNVGDLYDDACALTEVAKGSLPLMDIIYNGLPSIISEVNWTPPNRFRADFPFLFATYGVLQGTDGVYFFALSGPSWQQVLSKFSIQTPVVMGQFPADALVYRLGLVQESQPVVEANLKLQDLFALKGAPVSQPVNLDELRARDIPAGQTAQVQQLEAIDPLAHLVGKVQMNFVERDTPSRIADLSRYIDRNGSKVRSITGELLWDYGSGLVTVNAPKAQGVCGFLQKAGTVRLRDVTISSPVGYGTILLVPLDGQPLRTSRKMLLQVMSEDTNYGWSAPGTGKRAIQNLGTAPINVRRFSGTVTLTRPDASQLKVTPLDWNGYPAGKPTPGGKINLQPTVMYYLIER